MVRPSATGLHLQAGTVPGAGFPVPLEPAFSTCPVPCGLDADVPWFRDVMKASTTKLAKSVTLQATLLIYRARHWLQVLRINASRDSASMINLQGSWYWTHKVNVEGSVGQGRSVKWSTQETVSLVVQSPLPDPATFMINDIPGPVVDQGRGIVSSPTLPEALVMLGAQAETQSIMARTSIHYAELHGNQSRVQEEVMPE